MQSLTLLPRIAINIIFVRVAHLLRFGWYIRTILAEFKISMNLKRMMKLSLHDKVLAIAGPARCTPFLVPNAARFIIRNNGLN